MTRSIWLGGIVLTAAVIGGIMLMAVGNHTPTLRIFIWEEYIDPEVYRLFEREFGVAVLEDNYGSNEDMHAKLQAGGAVYDLIVPSDYMVTLLRREGLLLPVDTSRIPNLQHIAARFKEPRYDPGHQYSVPYQWGITGIGYHTTQVVPPPTSWHDLFEGTHLEAYKNRISMLNDRREVIGAALMALGHSPESPDAQHLAAAKDLLIQQKLYLAKYDSESFEDSLASGETVLAQGWSGEIAIAQSQNPAIGFVIPAEGAFIFVDNWAIPKGARHKELAEDFINFILRPEISARIVNHAWYASVNDAATPFIKPEILQGPSYRVPENVKLWWHDDIGDANQLYERVWWEVKGQ
jgi:spermidine/putrescine transport system substrate-binding protein